MVWRSGIVMFFRLESFSVSITYCRGVIITLYYSFLKTHLFRKNVCEIARYMLLKRYCPTTTLLPGIYGNSASLKYANCNVVWEKKNDRCNNNTPEGRKCLEGIWKEGYGRRVTNIVCMYTLCCMFSSSCGLGLLWIADFPFFFFFFSCDFNVLKSLFWRFSIVLNLKESFIFRVMVKVNQINEFIFFIIINFETELRFSISFLIWIYENFFNSFLFLCFSFFFFLKTFFNFLVTLNKYLNLTHR